MASVVLEAHAPASTPHVHTIQGRSNNTYLSGKCKINSWIFNLNMLLTLIPDLSYKEIWEEALLGREMLSSFFFLIYVEFTGNAVHVIT